MIVAHDEAGAKAKQKYHNNISKCMIVHEQIGANRSDTMEPMTARESEEMNSDDSWTPDLKFLLPNVDNAKTTGDDEISASS